MQPLRALNVGCGNAGGEKGLRSEGTACAKARRADGAPWVGGSRKSWVWLWELGCGVEGAGGGAGLGEEKSHTSPDITLSIGYTSFLPGQPGIGFG